MTIQPPTWTAFQPDAAPPLPSGRGHVVALLALAGLGEPDGGAGLAVELARAWGASGNRVVLADLGLTEPRLHEALGMDNRDGVSDAVAFGASVGRVARSVDGAPFFFIGAGTAVADPASLLEHDRWAALCQGFQEAGATLAVFVPADAVTREGVLAHATEVVLLGGPDEGAALPGLDGGQEVLALVGPAPGTSWAGADAGTEVEEEPTPVEEAWEEEAPEEERPAAETAAEADPLEEDGEAETLVEEAGEEPASGADAPDEPAPPVARTVPEAPGPEEGETEADLERGEFAVDAEDLPQATPSDFALLGEIEAGAASADLDVDGVPGSETRYEPRREATEGGSEAERSDAADEQEGDDGFDLGSEDLPEGDTMMEEAGAVADEEALSLDTDGPSGDDRASDELALQPEAADIVGELGLPDETPAVDEGAPVDFALPPEEPEEPAAPADDLALEPGEPSGEDFALEPEEPSGDDFALEPEPSAGGAEPEAAPAAAEEPEHPDVPLADEILAEAGDAPEVPLYTADAIPEYPPDEEGGGSSTTRTLLLLLLLLVAVAAGWWLGYLEIPGVPGPESLRSAAPAAERVAPLAAAEASAGTASEAAEEVAPVASWAIALEAHRDAAVARDRAETLAAQAPGELWFTAPVVVDGTLFHRVLVGTAADPEAAEALRARVAASLDLPGDGWLLRYSPFAWRLGEEETLAEARDRADSLRERGVPAYVLAVPFSDGSERYRIYAGAYAEESEAAWLGGFLEEEGLAGPEGPELTERAGRLPE